MSRVTRCWCTWSVLLGEPSAGFAGRAMCLPEPVGEAGENAVVPRERAGPLSASAGWAGNMVMRAFAESSSAASSPGRVDFLTRGGLGIEKPK